MKSTHKPKIDLVGKKFGRLTVVQLAPSKRGNSYVWLCKCSCGNPNLHPVTGTNLKRTKSCGCFKAERSGKASITHGESKSQRYRMWTAAKCRAKHLDIPFDIDLKDIFIPPKCPVFGVELIQGENLKKPTNNSPSLDRIHPSRGYVKSNIWVISNRANRIKNNSSIHDLEKIILALTKKGIRNEIY
tara:strand:+ start:43 stop:603 length:561 start_codon:yes stop_codon:yes gene_type:complete